MVERETREAAEERILDTQADILARLEANQKYQELDFLTQDKVSRALVPQLFDPRYEITKLLKDIQISKKLIDQCNELVMKAPELSDTCSEVITLERECINQSLEQIKRIKRGDFEWVTK